MSNIHKQKDNVQKLLELIKENPGVAVVPEVDYDVCFSPDFSSFLGSFGPPRIDYLQAGEDVGTYLNEECYFFKSRDSEHIKEEIQYHLEWLEQFTEEELEEKAEKEYQEIKWKKVIVVPIGIPDPDLL